jgi:hypothetical protein
LPTRIKYAALTTKLKSFAYKIQNGLLYCSYELHKFGKRENPECPACKHNKADKYHVMLDCPSSEEIWNQLGNVFRECRDLTNIEKICGVDSTRDDYENNAINFIIYSTASYIYRCASIGCKPDFEKLILEIKRKAEQEIGVTNLNGTLSKHAVKAEITLQKLTTGIGPG